MVSEVTPLSEVTPSDGTSHFGVMTSNNAKALNMVCRALHLANVLVNVVIMRICNFVSVIDLTDCCIKVDSS